MHWIANLLYEYMNKSFLKVIISLGWPASGETALVGDDWQCDIWLVEKLWLLDSAQLLRSLESVTKTGFKYLCLMQQRETWSGKNESIQQWNYSWARVRSKHEAHRCFRGSDVNSKIHLLVCCCFEISFEKEAFLCQLFGVTVISMHHCFTCEANLYTISL